MSVADAKLHLAEAARVLRIEEAYRVSMEGEETPMPDFLIAEELERIDSALGPKGKSMFASIADRVRQAYVEIKAAEAALVDRPDERGE